MHFLSDKGQGNVSYPDCSLNEQHRQRELERVAMENKSMLKRLQVAKPMYRVADWVNDWQRKEELTSMITSYPQGPSIPVANKVRPDRDRTMSPLLTGPSRHRSR